MLYAQVIVKKKTRVEELTYSISAPIIPFIRVGSLVTVPLRSGVVEAVVVGFRRTVPRELREKIRPMASVVKDRPVYSENQIRVIEALAAQTGASLAEVAFHALREPLVESGAVEPVAVSRPVFLQAVLADRVARYRQLLEKLPAGRTALFIFAQSSMAEFFYTGLPAKLQTQVVLDDGTAGQRKKREKLQATGDLRAVVGTIGTAFWPLQPGDTLVVDQPDHIGAISGQRPFLSTKQIAITRSQVENLRLILGDTLVAIEDIPQLQAKIWRMQAVASMPPDFLIASRQRSPELLLPSLKDRLAAVVAGDKKVLLFVLSRGWASALICRDCSHVFTCAKCGRTAAIHGQKLSCPACAHAASLPIACPNCRSSRLGHVGEGVAQVAATVAKTWPVASLQQLSSDQPIFDATAQITVATEKILSFPAAAFDELLVVSADRLLSGVELDGQWRLASDLLELASRVKSVAIQTYFPDSPLWQTISSGQLRPFYERELTARRQLLLPPYGLIFQVLGQAATSSALLAEAERVAQVVESFFPTVSVTIPSNTQKIGRDYHLSIQGYLPQAKVTSAQKSRLRHLIPPAWFVKW